MAKIEYVKYLVGGLGAVAIPALAGEMVAKAVASVSFLVTPIQGVTPVTLVLAAVGVGIADQIAK